MHVAMRFAMLGGIILVGARAFAQPAKPSDEEIRKAVKDLGDERFAVRQRAMKMLWNARELAEKPLREAANSGDPEVVRQARVLLDRILYRIEPDTPQAVVALMQRFRDATGNTSEQAQVVREMLRLGSKGHKYLLRLLDAVEDKTRRIILDEFAYDDWKVLGALLADGQSSVVDELLDKALAAQNETIVPHYVAFQLQANRLGTKIQEFRKKAEKSGQVFDARVLLVLCRLANDTEGALWAAKRAQDPTRERQLLAELCRWSELRDEMGQVRPGLNAVTDLGYLAAYQRLAGREADFKKTLQQIEAYAGEPDGGRVNRPSYAAKALLINERPVEAIALLRKHNQTEALVELLVGQARYGEALEMSEHAAAAESGNRYAARAGHIDLLLRAGITAKAREALQKLLIDMGDHSEPDWLDRLSGFQMRLGDRTDVEKRLLARLEKGDGSSFGPMFAMLYPRLDWRAEAVLTMLRQQQPNVETAKLLPKLREID
jgi:hypothetical protein